MERGRTICNILKEVRSTIARLNDIPYTVRECTHEGPCAGTCPACEAEVSYLEQALQERRRRGAIGRVVGVSMGIGALLPAVSSCSSCQKVAGNMEPGPAPTSEDEHEPLAGKVEPPLEGDVVYIPQESIPVSPADSVKVEPRDPSKPDSAAVVKLLQDDGKEIVMGMLMTEPQKPARRKRK